MEIEKQVCSRELAEKMKELGFKSENLYIYFFEGEDWNIRDWNEAMPANIAMKYNNVVIAAYTVAELGEMLPKIKLINGRECSLRIWANDTGEYWYCGYGRNGIMEINGSHGKGKTLAEAMSKMLIYLAEQNLINPKEIKLWK